PGTTVFQRAAVAWRNLEGGGELRDGGIGCRAEGQRAAIRRRYAIPAQDHAAGDFGGGLRRCTGRRSKFLDWLRLGLRRRRGRLGGGFDRGLLHRRLGLGGTGGKCDGENDQA